MGLKLKTLDLKKIDPEIIKIANAQLDEKNKSLSDTLLREKQIKKRVADVTRDLNVELATVRANRKQLSDDIVKIHNRSYEDYKNAITYDFNTNSKCTIEKENIIAQMDVSDEKVNMKLELHRDHIHMYYYSNSIIYGDGEHGNFESLFTSYDPKTLTMMFQDDEFVLSIDTFDHPIEEESLHCEWKITFKYQRDFDLVRYWFDHHASQHPRPRRRRRSDSGSGSDGGGSDSD